MNTQHRSRRARAAGLITAAATASLLLVSCATEADTTSGATATGPSAGADTTALGTEVDSASPRVVLTYDGGIYVVDATTLSVLADIPVEGFTRVNSAGDGRHALVTTAAGFEVLDAGAWTDESGAHFTTEPELTDLVFAADTAGHVVRHGDKTILFADGSGDTTIFETAALRDAGDTLPETEVVASEAAHHGVAIELEDGTLLSTLGTEEERTGVRVLDADRNEINRNEECPSVHGEGAAAGERAVFGCSDGVLIYDSGEFTKITAPDAYGRTGNQYTTDTSTITVGDYNSDPDSESTALTQLVVTDTVAKEYQVITLPGGAEYTWRDVARGPDDEAYVLGTDGALHTLDVETASFTDSVPVIEPWKGPAEWQDAHPALTVLGSTAYITEPAAQAVHAVDLGTGEVIGTAQLDAAPNEIAVVTG